MQTTLITPLKFEVSVGTSEWACKRTIQYAETIIEFLYIADLSAYKEWTVEYCLKGWLEDLVKEEVLQNVGPSHYRFHEFISYTPVTMAILSEVRTYLSGGELPYRTCDEQVFVQHLQNLHKYWD